MSGDLKKVMHLQKGDEIEELIKKLKDVAEPNIVFVIPQGLKILRNPVNARLLKYYSEQLSKDIQVVTWDKITWEICRDSGIKVSKSKEQKELEQLELNDKGWDKVTGKKSNDGKETSAPIKSNRRDFKLRKEGKSPRLQEGGSKKKTLFSRKKKKSWGLYAIAVGIFSLVFLAITYAALPKATVIVNPTERTIDDVIVLRAISDQQTVDSTSMKIPAGIIERTFDVDMTIPTTGSKLVGIKEAHGYVTLVNESSSHIAVPGGTIVVSSCGAQYETLEDATVPPAEVDYIVDLTVGMKTGLIEVPVQAREKGASANAEAGSIRGIEGDYPHLKVINATAVEGGQDTVQRIVARRDIENLKEKIEVEIQQQAWGELGRELSNDFVLIDESLSVETVDLIFDKLLGDEGREITGIARVNARGSVVTESDIMSVLEGRFIANLPSDVELVEDGLIIRDVEIDMLNNDDAELVLNTEGLVRSAVNRRSVARSLMGLPVSEAVEVLAGMTSISGFEVFFMEEEELLPGYAFLIRVVVNNDSER